MFCNQCGAQIDDNSKVCGTFYDVTGREAYIYHDMHGERMLIIL